MLLGLLTTDNTTIGSTALHTALASSWGSSDNRSGSSCGCRGRCCGSSGLLNRARGIAVSPGTNSGDVVVVGISLGGTPGCDVSVDGGTSEVEDSHVVEGEGTGRSRSRAVSGGADGPRAGSSGWSRTGSSGW